MAKAIAAIGGTALVPGISRNRRLYSREVIAGAVAAAQERIGSTGLPLTMLTHHGAEDSSDRIVGRVTSMTLAEDGSARFTADIADTPHGRTIASLIDTSDGKPAFLSGVSIRGAWTGKVRREAGPDGKGPVEAGSGLSLMGLDYTASPGVTGAAVDTFAWAADGQQETEERVLITESVEVERMTISEDATAEPVTETTRPEVPEGVREALATLFGPVTEASLPGTVSMSKRKSGMSGSGRKYADPGYQSDKKQRYDITDKDHAVAAWRYISQASKASKYSAAQLKNIKARIRAALSSFGVKAAAEGWVILPEYRVTEAVAEFYGDPSKAGSWCVTACNGPVSLSMSCYSMDPADLNAVLTAAAGAAGSALAALDPDMDGDIDVPGATSSDTDGDGGHETAPEDGDPATETAPPADAGGESPAPAGTTESEVSAMPEDTATTTEAGGTAPAGLTLEDIRKATAEAAQAAAQSVLEADRKARKDARKAAKKATAEAAPAAPVKETAATESADERDARLIAAALKAAGFEPPVQETEEDRIARMAKEMFTGFVQEAVAAGAVVPGRSGLQVREHATDPDEAPDAEALAAMSDDDFQKYGGANLDKYVGDYTRIQAIHT